MKKPSKAKASNTLKIQAPPGKSEARVMAELTTDGVATNAVTMQRFATDGFGALSLTELLAALNESGQAVNANDLAHAERVLNAQALTLNMMFAELASRAALNMGEHLGATESYMRLALRAQNQSRATFETLAALKNPPVVFAKQMNVANGPQQVNNHGDMAHSARAPAYVTESQPNELKEGSPHVGTPLDTRTTTGAIGAHQRQPAVATVHGPTNR